MVELIINGNQIELPKGTTIKYSKQISDIFDIAKVSCSFTSSFSFDKTPVNTQAMQQLGINGDSSAIPYQKNTSQLKANGFDLISKGWYLPDNTTDRYSGSIIDGMIDFFKAIENKTMGKDLDLSNFNHEKLLNTVISSFTNNYYKYIIADYGGKNLFESGINIDYLAPCFSVRKLWELIFSTFGFKCDYTNLSYLDGLFLTYPKDVSEGQTNELIATLHKNGYKDLGMRNIGGISQPPISRYSWDSSVITEGSLQSNWNFIIPETTSYYFDLSVEDYIIFRRPNYYNRNVNTRLDILRNGVIIGSILSDYLEHDEVGNERILQFNISCNIYDVISIRITAPQSLEFRNRNFRSYEWHLNKMDFLISKTDLGTTILENELKDFQIKDFIKEILWRTGLTPIYDYTINTVKFIPLQERLDFDNSQDLSNCYVERVGEGYTNDYAQKNIFALKRDADTDFNGDGYLYVFNKNIDDEKTLAQSKMYAPDNKIVTSFGDFSTNQYKVWQLELKDNEGEAEVSYKGLSGRFYFIRYFEQSGSFKIISEKLNDETVVLNVPVGINSNTLFEESVFNNYLDYQKIFQNFRIHNISLALNENDFIGLDLTKAVYFKQENAFYICNKVDFEDGKLVVGEFVKINKL